MNHLQAFRRPPLHQPTDLQRRLAWLIVSALALVLGGCGGGGSSKEGSLVAEKSKAVGVQSDSASSDTQEDRQFTSDGARVYLGETFEPDVNKTDFFDVCGEVPEALLRKYGLTMQPAEMQAGMNRPDLGVSSCSFYDHDVSGLNGSVTLISTLQSNEVRAVLAPEELHGYFIESLPDARFFGATFFSESLCEVSVDTSRGRISVGGAFGLGNKDRAEQCRRNGEILHQLIAVSKGEFDGSI